jgi:hypothetical protein
MSIKTSSITAAILTGVLLTSSVANILYAKDIAIYRWVDKNNVVHFSQNLPRGDEYTELSTVSSYKALSKAERKTLAEQDTADQKVEEQERLIDDVAAKNKATYDKNCKAARLNIKMLSSLDDIHINEEKSDGTVGSRSLTPTEKSDKLALSKKHQALYCGN